MQYHSSNNNNKQMAALTRAAICIAKTNLYILVWVLCTAVVFFSLSDMRIVGEKIITVSACQQDPAVDSVIDITLHPVFDEHQSPWSGEVRYLNQRQGFFGVRLELSDGERGLFKQLARAGCQVEGISTSERLLIKHVGLASNITLSFSALLIAGLLLAFGPFMPLMSSRFIGLAAAKALSCFLMGAALGMGLGFAAHQVSEAEEAATQSLLLSSEVGFFSALLLYVLVWPLAEEIVFRRIALQMWIESQLPLFGIILVSLGFAILHGHLVSPGPLNWIAFVMVFLMSIGASVAYLRGGLLASFLFHAGYNAILILPLYWYP